MVDFFSNGLIIHSHIALMELTSFSEYHNQAESSWKKKDEVIQEKLSDELSRFPEEHHDDIIDSYSWNLHVNQYKYPGIHRKSLVITLHSFVEEQLNNLCGIFSEFTQSNIKLKNLHGQGIERSHLYLTKVACIDLSSVNNEWSYIQKINYLRNILIHNGSSLPEERNHKVNVFVNENINLNGVPGKEVTIYSGLVDEYIEVLNRFFWGLDRELQKFVVEYLGPE